MISAGIPLSLSSSFSRSRSIYQCLRTHHLRFNFANPAIASALILSIQRPPWVLARPRKVREKGGTGGEGRGREGGSPLEEDPPTCTFVNPHPMKYQNEGKLLKGVPIGDCRSHAQ